MVGMGRTLYPAGYTMPPGYQPGDYVPDEYLERVLQVLAAEERGELFPFGGEPPAGAPRVINRLHEVTKQFDESFTVTDSSTECRICLEELVDGAEVGVPSACFHVYCASCIIRHRYNPTTLLPTKPWCPTCRVPSHRIVYTHFHRAKPVSNDSAPTDLPPLVPASSLSASSNPRPNRTSGNNHRRRRNRRRKKKT